MPPEVAVTQNSHLITVMGREVFVERQIFSGESTGTFGTYRMKTDNANARNIVY